MIRRLFLDNLSLKAAALFFAVLLWIFVSSKGQTEIVLDAPIEYVNIPQGIEISRHEAKAANVFLRGHESLLKNVRQGDVRVSIDVSRAREGEAVFAIKADDVRVPNTVAVTKIEPASVKVVFEKTLSKRVVVRPVITGIPESGFYVKSVEIAPRDTEIEGAQSEVGRIGYLRTEPIDITGLAEDLRQDVDIALTGKPVRTKNTRVSITITVARRGK